MAIFDDTQSLGAEAPDNIAQYLQEIGDEDGAKNLRAQGASGQAFGTWANSAHLQTGVKIGFVAESDLPDLLSIQSGNSLVADESMIGKQVKVTLDRFYVHTYPGLGEHQILCEFAGKNQCDDTAEEIRFALTVRARNGSGASVSGSPIFVGLSVGRDGIAFQGRTVSVRNSGDEWLLEALSSDIFHTGLALVSTTQPVLKPFIKLAGEAVASTLKRRKNKQISAFDLGLDFSSNATSAKIRFGSYVIVQGDSATWQWSDVRLCRDTNTILNMGTREPLKQNYMILGITPAYSTAGSQKGAQGAAPRGRSKK